MTRVDRQPLRQVSVAIFWLTALAVALIGQQSFGENYPSDAWAPSEAWSPPVALPQVGTLFSEPPLGSVTTECSTCDGWQPHSSYMRSLGRYGFLAPRPPGAASVPSACTTNPASCGQPAEVESLFSPPPCAAGNDPCGNDGPCFDQRAWLSPYNTGDFSPDAFGDQSYSACQELGIYGDKYLNPTQRPLIELGMPLYLGGPVPPPNCDCGPTNPSLPRFYLYGDYRAAAAYNDQLDDAKGVLAQRLNLEWDLWLTSTERFHMFTGPLQRNNNFQRIEFNDGRSEFFGEMDFFDADTDTAFFEGDLGYMLGGWCGRYASFDMPITAGLIPLVFQNGVWMNDAIVGVAATIPARNNPWLDWSNYDITFFAGFDQVTSPAFDEDQSAARVVGATTFIEAKGGYIELGYAFLDDRDVAGRSYNNVGLSYTRRYLNMVSNSMRVIVNSGQNGPVDDRSANGVLLISENSFLSPWPYNVVPYMNSWVGIDDPQSVARSGAAGGVLFNEGILFESDNLTGYPTLDATANNTCGTAFGIDLLSPEFCHQLILETAMVHVFGDAATRNAQGDEYGIGLRYQVNISNASLLRFDVMHGWLDNADDITGARAEYRWKF